MKYKTLAILFLIAFNTEASAGEIVITNAVAKDVGHTYGFYLGQQSSLNLIERQFPKLASKVRVATAEFSAAFGHSLSAMDDEMTGLSKPEWEKIKRDLEDSVEKNTSKISISQGDAESFLNEVRNRAKGAIPSPAVETLLMFSPTYQLNPAREFTDGFRQKVSIDGSGTAKGVAFNLEAPKSWKLKEGNRPNIVAKLDRDCRTPTLFSVFKYDARPSSPTRTRTFLAIRRGRLAGSCSAPV